jgi:hypothetical protein
VLEPKLREAGGKLPKWQPRTRRGQFLGFSNRHASTVGLIHNLHTGTITPQFHCVYDSEFETVGSSDGTAPSNWYDLVSNHRYATTLDETDDVQLAEDWLTPDEIAQNRARHLQREPPPSSQREHSSPTSPTPISDFSQDSSEATTPVSPSPASSPILSPEGGGSPNNTSPVSGDINGIQHERDASDQVNAPRRSSRLQQLPQTNYKGMSLSDWCTSTLMKTYAYLPNAPPAYKYLAFLLHDWEAGTVENILPQEPFAFVSKQKGLDVGIQSISCGRK